MISFRTMQKVIQSSSKIHGSQARHKVAIFDIDGTVFRSSLLIELTEALIQERLFPENTRKVYAKHYKNWLDRKDSYEKYIGAVVRAFEQNIKGINRKDFLKVADYVKGFHKDRIYRYSRDLIKKLKKQKYFLLAISNSPKEVVEVFCKKIGFNKVYGRVYETGARGEFTGKILYEDLISDKAKILRRVVEKEGLSLTGSIGVGDTESDIPFLKMVERQVCFNPNKKLYYYAKRAGWKIVVERKDVIYALKI